MLTFFEICFIRIVSSWCIYNSQLVYLIWLNHEGFFKIEFAKVTGNNIMYNYINRQVFFHRYHILLVTRGQPFQNCTVLQITNWNFEFKCLSSKLPFISVILNHHEIFFNSLLATLLLQINCCSQCDKNTFSNNKRKSNNLIQLNINYLYLFYRYRITGYRSRIHT